jgi:hypothetical protein
VCERRNSEIYRILGKWVTTSQAGWDQHLDPLNSVLCNMHHSTLKNTAQLHPARSRAYPANRPS